MSDRDEMSRKRAHEASNRITVGYLRLVLDAFDDETEVSFGAAAEGEHPLLFRRAKVRGPIDGPVTLFVELDELTDDAMRDEIAWAWVRRVGELAEAVLFIAGDKGTVRPTRGQTAELQTMVAALKADPTLLDGADGFVGSLDTETNVRVARALRVVAHWAGLG